MVKNILFLGRKMVASGGVENYMYNLFSSINRDEFKIDFLIPHQSRDEQAYLDEIEEQGGEVFLIPNQKENLWQHIVSSYKIFKNYKQGIVHIHASDGFHAIDGIIARCAGVKRVLYHSHNASFKKGIGKKIGRYLFKISGYYFLGCSEDAGEYLFGQEIVESNKFSVAKNAIDTTQFKYNPEKRESIRNEFSIPNETFLLGFVGRLSSEKNVDFIINVFNELLTQKPESRLMLVGDGDEKLVLENLTKQLGINDKVIFAGVRQDIDYIMSGLDVLLLPSDFEALGIVLIEGQTSGLQCFASTNVSSEAKISNRLSYLDLKVEDWVGPISHLEKNLNREKSYIETQKSGYDLSDSAIKMEELYQELLNE